MTGLILVVDDVPANVKLLEAKLSNEYYDVISGKDGYEALARAKESKPDLILLDVMMPGMDGFETCSRLKKDPELAHIPVVMVTALSEPSDRVQGLEAGADDFITKPINDTALFARVKSLVRMKVLIDELRLRDQSGAQMGIMNDLMGAAMDVSGATIWLIDDDAVQCRRMKEKLDETYKVTIFEDHKVALDLAKTDDVDLIMISTQLGDIDGLRLATQVKAIERARHVPIVMLVDEQDQSLMLKALDLGVNDYLIVPLDYNEMLARVKTQLRRKRYQDALKSNYQESVSMAITDGLTGLYNRHYLDTHLKNLAESSLKNKKQLSLVIMDMDHFKSVNDTYGHDVGDQVLIHLAKVMVNCFRSADLSARYGGEEFVVLMPETDFQSAYEAAERMRKSVETTPFPVNHVVGQLSKTISIGVSNLNLDDDTPEALLKRADKALYVAKNSGRNRVCPKVVNGVAEPLEGAAAKPAPTPVAPVMVSLEPVVVPPLAEVPLAPSHAATTATQPVAYDPTLHAKITAVNQAGQGANRMELTPEQKAALLELKRQELAVKPAEPSGPSPIDDEPPGTF